MHKYSSSRRKGCMNLKEETVALRISDKTQVWMGAYVCRVCVFGLY